MKIVILDGYAINPGDLSWEAFKEYGDVIVYDRTTYNIEEQEKVLERIGDAEILLLNKTPVTRETIIKAPNLRYIGVLATGYNIVDVNAAKERGIVVTNIPTYGTASVAQFTFALILELCHRIGHHSEEVKRGRWENNPDWCFWDYPLIELEGKNIGIIGYGRIGQAVGKIAQAFGMKVLVYTRNPGKEAEKGDIRFVNLDVLFSESDFISLHCPLTDETKGIINKSTIEKMKRGAFIINTSRGGLVVEEDLASALNEGVLGGATVDVVSEEPIKKDNPLLKAKNCIITPHIAWAPFEARKRLVEIAVDNLKSFLDGKPKNVVNP